MDKMLFNVDDEYTVCQKCGAYVSPMNRTRCDECREPLPNTFLRFTREDYDNLRAGDSGNSNSASKVTADDSLVCMICGKTYPEGNTVCLDPDCGGLLMPNIKGDEDSATKAPQTGAAESNTGYGFEAYRFENGEKIRSRLKVFPIEEKYLFGRVNLYRDDRFFFTDITQEDAKRIAHNYATICKEHCCFTNESGKLFVELANDKASVRVNGTKIKIGEKRKLAAEDEILIGSQDNKDRKVLFVIKRMGNPASDISMEESREFLRQIVHEEVHEEINQLVEFLSINNVHRAENESDEQYCSRIIESEIDPTEGEQLTTEERICRFLMIPDRNGSSMLDCRAEYYAVKERLEIEKILRKASMVEEMLNASEEEEDYSDLLLIIGKAFEEAIMVYLVTILRRTNNPYFDNEIAKTKRLEKKSLDMGFVVRYFEEGAISKKIWNVVTGAGYKQEQKYYDEVKNMTSQLKKAADARNTLGGHAPASKGANKKEVQEKYRADNKLTIVNRSKYLEVKRKCFCNKTLQTLVEYDRRIEERQL